MTLLSAVKLERLIPLVISFLSVQEPLGFQGGLTQRQMEPKGSFPAEKNPPEKTPQLQFLNSS